MVGAQDNVTIVFKGLPQTWYGPDSVQLAEEQAAELAERDQEDYSILVIPRTALKGLVARYHGVVLHSLEEALKEEN
ncbi:MAG TPA: hypothetical protein VFK47_15560 [Ktedonobacteraceae bacterium]|nr:hypothetical protein [Ktedonobacteraceae bacterium]